MVFPSVSVDDMLCSKCKIVDDVHNDSEIKDVKHSEETGCTNYQPPAGTLCMNEKEEDQINNKCTLLLKLFVSSKIPDY